MSNSGKSFCTNIFAIAARLPLDFCPHNILNPWSAFLIHEQFKNLYFQKIRYEGTSLKASSMHVHLNSKKTNITLQNFSLGHFSPRKFQCLEISVSENFSAWKFQCLELLNIFFFLKCWKSDPPWLLPSRQKLVFECWTNTIHDFTIPTQKEHTSSYLTQVHVEPERPTHPGSWGSIKIVNHRLFKSF